MSQSTLKIGFIGGHLGSREVALRYDGFARAMTENGKEIDSDLVYYGNYGRESGYEQARLILERESLPDGILLCSDMMTIGMIEAMREKSLIPGKDIRLVGFDDIPLASYCTPPLTTIRQNIPVIGELLVNNLLQNIVHGTVTRSVVPISLVVRQSG